MKKEIFATMAVLVVTLLFVYGCAQSSIPVKPQQAPQPMPPIAAPASAQQSPAEPQSTEDIQIKEFSFNPSSITVQKGTIVTWIQMDSVQHTITSDDGAFESSPLAKGESWSFTFNTPGTYTYHCSPHPGMKGEIIVQ
jgi:plastocyanin